MKIIYFVCVVITNFGLFACGELVTKKIAADTTTTTTKKTIQKTEKKDSKALLLRKWKLNVAESMQAYRNKFPDVPESQSQSVQADYQNLKSTYKFLADGTCQSTEGNDNFEYTWTISADDKIIKMSHDAIGTRNWVIVELTAQKFIVKPNGETDAPIVLEEFKVDLKH